MLALTPLQIRECFVNLASDDASHIPMPGLHDVIWEQREYLGWRDRQARQRGYLVYVGANGPVGIAVRASEAPLQRALSAMCSLCRITQPSDQVNLFAAPRAGQAGVDGNTVGTYICADLSCSHLIRILPPASEMLDPQVLLDQRIAGLKSRLESFTADVAA